jgi:hypothetical protein
MVKDSTDQGGEVKSKINDNNVPSHGKGCFVFFLAFISKLFSFTLSGKKKSDSNDPDIISFILTLMLYNIS